MILGKLNLYQTFRAILVFCIVLFSSVTAEASHMFGADLFYTHVSGNTYNITMVIYADCSGSAFPNLPGSIPQIVIFNGSTQVAVIGLPIVAPSSGVEVTPVCPAQINNTTCVSLTGTVPGVKKFVYSSSYTLSGPSNNWRFHFNGDLSGGNQAGRSNTITNVQGVGTTLMGLEATLNNIGGPNSSPTYTTIPTPFYCVNVPSNYNPGCVDPNSDNLVFSLVDGFDEALGIGALVTYNTPYNAQNPLGVATGSFTFNSTNGQMAFTPNIVQKSLVVGKVAEWKNGVMVGTSMREMTFVVLSNCNNNPPNGGISNPSGGTVVNSTTFSICQSAGAFSFNINPTDPNGNIITMSANGLPTGSTFTITNNNTSSPTGLFNWNVSSVTPGTYTFYITYADNGCPLVSGQTIAYTINVLPTPLFSIVLVSPATCVKKARFNVIPATGSGIWAETVLQGTTVVHTITNLSGTLLDSLSPGTYTVRMTNSSGCFTDVPLTIAAPPVIIPTVSIVNPTCPNISNGSITITGSNGLAPYLYALGTGAYSPTNTFNGLAVGTYVLHIKDGNFCIKDTTVTLTAPNTTLLTMGIDRPTCNGVDNGIISILGSNSVAPYTYAIGSGTYSSTNTFGSLAAGTYVLHVMNGQGCIKDTTITITDSVAVHATIPLTNILCNGGNTGSITVNGNSGTGPVYTYALGTGTFSTTNVFSPLVAGTYVVHVIDNSGCYLDTTVTLTQPTPVASVTIPTNITCNGYNNGIITATGSGGVGPYAYALGTGAYQSSGTFSSLAPGTYTVHIKDANGCIKDVTITITQPAPIVIDSVKVTQPPCFGTATGSFVVYAHGGVPVLNYTVNANPYSTNNNITGLTAGTYTIHVKDANNCIKDTIITMLQPTAIVASAGLKNSTCATLHDGKVVLGATGGTPGYTYAVGGGAYGASNTFMPLIAGTYTFHIKDSKGCIKDTIITVIDSLNPVGAITITEPLCNGNNNGVILVTASGGANPYTYAIGTGAYSATNTFGSLLAGTYIIHIQDNLGCKKDSTITVTQPTPVQAQVTITTPKCNGDANGVIVVNGTGGTPGYQYAMNGGALAANNTFNNLSAGIDTIHVQDANGCNKDVIVTITQPDVLLISSLDITNVKCFGETSGQILVNAIGGTTAYSYSVDGNPLQPDNILTNLGVGIHGILVQDANNCQVDTTVTLTQPDPLYFTGAVVKDPTCEGFADGEIQLTAGGGTSPYQYSNDNIIFGTGNSFTQIPAGTFSYFITDANGCKHDTSVTFTGLPFIIIDSTTVTPTSCYGTADGSFTIIASGGVQPLSYQLNTEIPGSETTFTGLSSSAYNVTVIDNAGCKKSTDVFVPEPDTISLNPTVTPTDCEGLMNTGAISLDVKGGTAPYNYTWSVANETGSRVSSLSKGEYTVTVTDINNCSNSVSLFVGYDNCCQPFIPNAFTPNGDGRNDVFRIIYRGDMELLELSIYNRFGQQVFTTDNPMQSWDGYYKGRLADVGTYFYYTKFICGDKGDQKLTLKGDITLIR
jgi:gliding motility-associated-like protein